MNPRNRFSWRAILCLLASCLAMLSARAADPVPIKVLLITGGHGFDEEPFYKVFRENPAIAFTTAKHGKAADVYERPDLLDFDVIALYDMPKTITDEQKSRLLAFLDKGKGFVVLHHALVSCPDWPEYAELIGGHYSQADEKTGAAGYQHDVEVPVQIVAKDHPITKGIPDFTIRDEIYWGFKVSPNVTPLLTTTQPK